MKGLVALVLATIVVGILALMTYLGAFKDVALSTGEEGPFRLVYKQHVGPYHQIVPVIEEVEKWARANGEECRLSFGEYIDDPELVAEDRLHSHGGCVVSREFSSGLPEGFQYREVPRRSYVVAEFEGAPSIGPMKVYPKAKDLIKEKGLQADGPVIELYEILPGQQVRTRYLFPIKAE